MRPIRQGRQENTISKKNKNAVLCTILKTETHENHVCAEPLTALMRLQAQARNRKPPMRRYQTPSIRHRAQCPLQPMMTTMMTTMTTMTTMTMMLM